MSPRCLRRWMDQIRSLAQNLIALIHRWCQTFLKRHKPDSDDSPVKGTYFKCREFGLPVKIKLLSGKI